MELYCLEGQQLFILALARTELALQQCPPNCLYCNKGWSPNLLVADSRAVPSDMQSLLQRAEIQAVLLQGAVCARKAAGEEETIACAFLCKGSWLAKGLSIDLSLRLGLERSSKIMAQYPSLKPSAVSSCFAVPLETKKACVHWITLCVLEKAAS